MTGNKMPSFPHPKADKYDAVNAKVTGGAYIESSNQGFTGTVYVAGYIDQSDACTEFTVNVVDTGDYLISLRYAAGAAGNWNTDRTVGLVINQEEVVPIPFKSVSARWDVWQENIQKVKLQAGKNTISYRTITDNDNSDSINLDLLSVWKFDPQPTRDGIVFQNQDYNVSETHTIEASIQEVDSNGIRNKIKSTVDYSSEDPTIAMIDSETGGITGVKAGTTTIRAKSLGFTTETTITVLKNPTIIV